MSLSWRWNFDGDHLFCSCQLGLRGTFLEFGLRSAQISSIEHAMSESLNKRKKKKKRDEPELQNSIKLVNFEFRSKPACPVLSCLVFSCPFLSCYLSMSLLQEEQL